MASKRDAPRRAPIEVITISLRVSDIMTTGVLTIRPTTTYREIVNLLLDYDISGLPVLDLRGRLVGIVSEADLISKEAYGEADTPRPHLSLLRDHLRGHDPSWVHKAAARNARELMTSPARTIDPDSSVADAARIMLEERLKRLPVVEGGKLVGILARHDLLRPLTLGSADQRPATPPAADAAVTPPRSPAR